MCVLMFLCGSVRRGDVLSAWSGIRPLVVNPNSKDTQSIARNHIIEVSQSNLVTIAGQFNRYGDRFIHSFIHSSVHSFLHSFVNIIIVVVVIVVVVVVIIIFVVVVIII